MDLAAPALGDQLSGSTSHIHVGDATIPHTAFEVTSGTYGSVGHATVITSKVMLDIVGVNLIDKSGSTTVVPASLYAADSADNMVKIFDGDFLSSVWDMDQDMVTIHVRDHAGVFVDQKRVLARDAQALTAALSPLSPGQVLTPSGVSTMNRRVSQVVSDIATEFGYTPVFNMTEGQTWPGTDVLTGAVYGGSDHTYMTVPQNLWSILNTLARDTGNEVYTTPDRRLVFGTPGAGLPTLQLTWNQPSQQWEGPTDTVPCAKLQITHNPRRNSTFRVLVTSYDPAKATATIGHATFVADNLATSDLREGLYVGAAALSADAKLLANAKTKGQGSVSDLSHVQLYTFHWDGLTNDDADSRAAAIATDISKRLLLLRCTIDGLPSITQTQKLTISGPDLPQAFAGNTWYVSGFRHRFRIPRAGSRGSFSEGYTTEIQALDLPSVALAQSVR